MDRDAEQLRRLGYAQQLLREMGGFANFALSFSIISVLTGAVTLYGHGLRYGGPLQMSFGWPLVTLLTLPIALSLAELASAYPTAGALYHWPAFLLQRRGGPFAVGLLLAAWTFTGYDATAHVSEETHDPGRNAAWGMVLSVAVSGVAGYALLLAVTLAIGDLPAAAAADNPFIFILQSALGSSAGSALVLIAMAAMWFCGLSSVTSNSRMLFAFARDGGLPFSRPLATVSPRFRSPWVAVWTSAGAALAVALWADAYSAMVALSTIALYASYGLPILFHLVGRTLPPGPWNLGRHSKTVNLLAIAWIATTLVLFVLPPNQLAGYTFAGCLAALGVYWRFDQRDRCKG